MTALKADSSVCLTPSATDAALPAQALSPGPRSPPCPPYLLPTHLCSPGRREWGGSPGAPLPQQVSISSARSGCGQDQNTPQGWHRMLGQGDEQSGDQEAGRQRRKREKEKEKGKREKVAWGRSKGEMERERGVERKRKKKAKELQGKEALRIKREKKKEEGPLTQPFPSASLFPMVQGRNPREKNPCYCEGSCRRPGLCLLPGSRPELGVGSNGHGKQSSHGGRRPPSEGVRVQAPTKLGG